MLASMLVKHLPLITTQIWKNSGVYMDNSIGTERERCKAVRYSRDLLLVESRVEQPDETGEATPMVEVHACALGRVAPR